MILDNKGKTEQEVIKVKSWKLFILQGKKKCL